MLRVLNIQRMSTEDGPGLRTSVFFKGCPLNCQWCQNPESIPFTTAKEWIKQNCIYCLECLNHCPKGAITFKDDEIITNKELCDLCLKCVDVCPTGAMRAQGKDMEVEDLYLELIKDKAYFGLDGGITFTGGEAISQHEELYELAKRLKQDGLKLALDTSGFAHKMVMMKFSDVIDLFLYDLKLIEREAHIKYCGVDNELILNNLVELSKKNAKIWIRTPIIPGATDTIENIEGISAFLKEFNIDFQRWEFCAFNDLCKDKYLRLKLDWPYQNAEKITKKKMDALLKVARTILPEKEISATGATKWEEAK